MITDRRIPPCESFCCSPPAESLLRIPPPPPPPPPRRRPDSAPALYSILDRFYAGQISDREAGDLLGALVPQLQAEIDAIGWSVTGLGRELAGCPRCRTRGYVAADICPHTLEIAFTCSACGWIGEHAEVLTPPWGSVRR